MLDGLLSLVVELLNLLLFEDDLWFEALAHGDYIILVHDSLRFVSALHELRASSATLAYPNLL